MQVNVQNLKSGMRFKTWMGTVVTVVEVHKPQTFGNRAIKQMQGQTSITVATNNGPWSFKVGSEVEVLED